MELQQLLLQGLGPYTCPGPPGCGQDNRSKASIQRCSPTGAACPIYLGSPMCFVRCPPELTHTMLQWGEPGL